MKTTSDIQLVYLAKAGQDDRAFAELVRRHQARLRAFLLRLSGDPSLVDDIAQTTLMNAHRAIESFEGGSSFRSWLFAIAYREFLQARRHEVARAKLVNALEADASSSPAAFATASSDLSIDLRDALTRLPETERATILLCDAVGFTHAEAAAALGAPLGSVKTCLARARGKMRDALSTQANNMHLEPNGAFNVA